MADDLTTGQFNWQSTPPLVAPLQRPGDVTFSVKDPSIVFHDGAWHLFCSVRLKEGGFRVEYLTFPDWDRVGEAVRHLLTCHPGRWGAVQVFYFEPHSQWYLICQAWDESWDPVYQAAYATTEDIADPDSWSPLTPLGMRKANGEKAGLDYWIICDEEKAYLFFTTLDGHMWREETPLADFPHGWSEAIRKATSPYCKSTRRPQSFIR